jgi:predicted transposase YbfD/YdcC
VLAARAVESKGNEITAIPELLARLAIEGAVVTIDAIGTQEAIARTIIAKKADYLLALKENQGSLSPRCRPTRPCCSPLAGRIGASRTTCIGGSM